MSDTTPALTHIAAYAVDKGLARPNNEDVAAAVDVGLITDDAPKPVSLYAVADGMGGHDAGEVASKMAVDTTLQQIVSRWKRSNKRMREDYSQWLENAVRVANQKVYAINNGKNQTHYEDMGTTLIVAMVVGNDAFIANIGDCRAYHVTRAGMSQITTDHSMVQGLIDAGAITPEQAKKHPFRNYLTQVVGTEAEVDADLFVTELDAEDRLLLCSDGLTNELDDDSIYNIIQAANSPQSACEKLVAAANRSGGHDNISVVLVQMKPANVNS